MIKILFFMYIFISVHLYAETKEELAPSNTKAAVGSMLQGTSIDSPLRLRDPFKRSIKAKRSGKQMDKDPLTGEVSLDNVTVDSITITGVIVGKNRRAFAKIGDKNTAILREGMEIGPEKMVLKAILPGGVVFVEKIINVYGQEEFLETIVPVLK